MSPVTHFASSRSNSILQQIERAADASTAQPELFPAEFWENVVTRATNVKSAQLVLDEVEAYASQGIIVSKFVSFNLVHGMRVARTTLRNHEILKG